MEINNLTDSNSQKSKVAEKRYFVIEKSKKCSKGAKRVIQQCPICKLENARVHPRTFIADFLCCSIPMGACCYAFMLRHQYKFRQEITFPSEEKNQTVNATKRSRKAVKPCTKNCASLWQDQGLVHFKKLRVQRGSLLEKNGRRGGLVNGLRDKLCTSCRIDVVQQHIDNALLTPIQTRKKKAKEKGSKNYRVNNFPDSGTICYQYIFIILQKYELKLNFYLTHFTNLLCHFFTEKCL